MTTFVEQHSSNPNVSEDGIKINECSVGCNSILNKIVEQYQQINRIYFDYYIINLLTVIRNCYDPKLNEAQIFNKINQDVSLLKYYLTSYLAGCNYHPIIIFYLPIKYTIPELNQRSLSQRNANIMDLAKKMSSMLPNKLNDISQDNVGIFTVILTASPLPYIQINKHIQKLSNKGQRGSVWLMTHCPLDMHLYQLFPNLKLMESYTGELREPKDFGKKIFKLDHVPFIGPTHLAFGDNIHVKPILTRKDKPKVVELAEKRNWNIRTDREIIKDLSRYVTPISLIENVKLY